MRKFSEWAKAARGQVVNNPDWDQSPLIADRLTFEIAKFLRLFRFCRALVRVLRLVRVMSFPWVIGYLQPTG